MGLFDAFSTSISYGINFLPNMLGALVLLIVGWIIGVAVSRIIKKIVLKMKLDERISRTTAPSFRISDVFAILVKWAIYIVFIQASVDFLGIAALSSFLQGILTFLPGLVKAIIVLIIGYAIAEYVREQVEKTRIAFYDILSSVLFFLILYISVAMALPLVGIDPFLINGMLLIFIAAISIAVGIAVGYGVKDIVEETFKKYRKKSIR